MRFLIDNALSPALAGSLQKLGHDARHVRDYGLQAESDAAIFGFDAQDDRIRVSADTDFGTLVALGSALRPSVILFRRGTDRRPEKQAALLAANLPALEKILEDGCIVIIEEARIRVRRLPLEE